MAPRLDVPVASVLVDGIVIVGALFNAAFGVLSLLAPAVFLGLVGLPGAVLTPEAVLLAASPPSQENSPSIT
jgi:hypothetical protein